MSDATPNKPSKRPFYLALIVSLALVLVYWFGLPISFGYDPNEERCLPDVHLSLLVHHAPSETHDGDMLFFDKPQGILEYVREEYVMKVVAGVPGDRISISKDEVKINGKTVVTGFPLAVPYYHHPAQFYEKDEVIPKGKLFMIGTNPLSDDSRYWGYLDMSYVRGTGYRIF
jgi:conjugal transfer pilin signal peptidase TrbI